MSEENKKAELPAHRDKRFDGVRDTWYWKLSKPVRVVVHFVIRTRNAYIHYGGFKGMYRRWKQKKGEASKRLDFGTKSFPNAEAPGGLYVGKLGLSCEFYRLVGGVLS